MEQDPLSNFVMALRAEETKRQWPGRLKMVFDFLHLNGVIGDQAREFANKAREDSQWVNDGLMRFFSFQLQRVARKEISKNTVPNYYKAIKTFCEMNDLLLINWKKISRVLPKRRNAANDRAPTLEEIRRLIEYPDRRIKPIVYIMASSGIRVGAWDYLQWKHVSPITNDSGEIIAAKLIVYGGDAEEYYTFITPEAYNSLKEWMDFRASYGEKITDQSWLMRDIWQTTNIAYGANRALATHPIKLKHSGVKRLLERALWEQGLRQPLANGAKRHDWKAAHGFRKYYKLHSEQMMKSINVEITMGHDIGISESYYKPSEREILYDYMKAIDVLTINGDKSRLQKQVEDLKQETKDNEYIIKGKLQAKDQEIQSMQKQLKHVRDDMNDVLEVLKIAKTNNGKIGNDRTMFDENRRVTFGFVDKNNRLSEVKIPIDSVEIDENVLLEENEV